MEINPIGNGFTHEELMALAKNLGDQARTEGEKAAQKLKEIREDSAEQL